MSHTSRIFCLYPLKKGVRKKKQEDLTLKRKGAALLRIWIGFENSKVPKPFE